MCDIPPHVINILESEYVLFADPPKYYNDVYNRVFHITPFFELSYTLLTTHALGLYEFTKKISAL